MTQKNFNARLTDQEIASLARKANRLGLSKTALLKQWIAQEEVPTVADAESFTRRNLGNRRLRVTA